jgi:hypothetical protein
VLLCVQRRRGPALSVIHVCGARVSNGTARRDAFPLAGRFVFSGEGAAPRAANRDPGTVGDDPLRRVGRYREGDCSERTTAQC